MSKEERFTSVTVYLAKVIDHLQGVSDEYVAPIPRSHSHRATSSRVSAAIQIKDLLPDLAKAVSTSTAGEKRESTGIGPSEMVEPAD